MQSKFYLLLVVLGLFLMSFGVQANSVAGGTINITYTGVGNKYKVTAEILVDEGYNPLVAATTNPLNAYSGNIKGAIFSKGTSPSGDVLALGFDLPLISKQSIVYGNIECVTSQKLATTKITFSAEVDLPAGSYNNANGYYVVCQDGNRNVVTNIPFSTFVGITLYAEFPSLASVPNHSSAVFKDVANKVACIGQAFSLDLSASSALSTLSYSLVNPFSGPPNTTTALKNNTPPSARSYVTLSASAIPGLSLNPTTGVLSGTPTADGTFVITVECIESRGGNQIGVIRQDVEIRVENCSAPPKIYAENGDPTIHRSNIPLCDGGFRILETIYSPNFTYQWFLGGVAITGATTHKYTVENNATGSYTVVVTRTGACAGSATSLTTLVVPVGTAKNIQITAAATTFCSDNMPQILTITHTPAETGFSYEWYKDLVRTVGATANNLTITAGGYYKVIASKSLFGTTCFYKDSLQITVNTVPVAIINNITGKNGVCVGDVISLAATPPQTGVTYKWLNGAVVVGTNPTFDVTVSGNYSLYVETTTITPCFASTPAITLSVNPYPVVTFSAISPLCNVASAKIDLRNYISPAYLASSSLFQGRGIESDGYTFNPTLAGYGTHPLSYTYTNNTSSTSCAKTANQTAVVDITPKVRLGQDVTIFAGDAILLKTTGSQGPTFTYQWTPTTNLTLTPPESPIANPSNTETYKVVVTSTVSGCTDQDEITITVRPKLVFGNTFTPNADTINETWEIQGINGYPAAEVKIYNRWGNEIFSSIGYAQPFDGIQNKERLPGGTYYYVIKPSPDVPTLTGYLTIVR